MTSAYEYKMHVIGRNYVEGIAERNRVFKMSDTPKKWGMSLFSRENRRTFYNIGFVSDKLNGLYSAPAGIDGINFAWNQDKHPKPYWFCRSPYSWMPYWGEATKQRAELGKEIRAYWAHKWCTKTLPEMRKAILDSTPIPEDVYDEHFAGIFEYPHEIKNV